MYLNLTDASGNARNALLAAWNGSRDRGAILLLGVSPLNPACMAFVSGTCPRATGWVDAPQAEDINDPSSFWVLFGYDVQLLLGMLEPADPFFSFVS